MNILIISNLYPPDAVGGYEILCGQVAERLAAAGHQVTVLTSSGGVASEPGPNASRDALGQSPVRIVRELELLAPFGETMASSRLRRNRVGRRNASVALERIRELDPEIVFVWSQLRLTIAAARACEMAGLPVCYTMNDAHLAGFAPRRIEPSVRALAGAALDRFVVPRDTARALALDHVTCISQVVAEDLGSAGVPLRGPRIIHQGIPIDRFPLKGDPGSLHDPVRLLYAGQLLDYKGPQVLLEAAALIRSRHPGTALEVSVVGEGPMRSRLSELARTLSLPVRFTGGLRHAEMPRVYRGHDIFAFTSTWREPFGLTHLEAMASGTPVVSTTVGGQAEFLRDGENALTVAPGNPRALAEALCRLILDDELRRRIARGGRRTVEKGFTLSRYVGELDSWLAEVQRSEAA